jgi:hypothetical protein
MRFVARFSLLLVFSLAPFQFRFRNRKNVPHRFTELLGGFWVWFVSHAVSDAK